MTTETLAIAQELLSRLAGPDARMRGDQARAIEALVDEHRRVLVVQRTGWGKSAVYFGATAALRARGAGPTLLVSPLLALMRDQLAAAGRGGIAAHTVNSSNFEQWDDVEQLMADDAVDLLAISPERLNSGWFRDRVLDRLAGRVGMVVVDEAHCISDWGHDFRPDYRRVGQVLAGLAERTPVLGCTATANQRVMDDVAAQLGDHTLVLRGSLDRESLRLAVVATTDDAERLATAAAAVARFEGSGIIYTLTVAETARVADYLTSCGIEAAAYSSAVDGDERERIEDDLRDNRVKAVVATSALGMGFDKGDLAFCIHLGSPSSPVAYYQQVGRAGRAIDEAQALLLPGRSDRAIWDWFDSTSMPDADTCQLVLDALGDAPVSVPELERTVNLGRGRLESLLKVLDVDGAVTRVDGGWVATGAGWQLDHERMARVRATRRSEADAMVTYASGDVGCRMAFLRAQLDDPAEPCGRCDLCLGEEAVAPDAELVAAARRHLRTVDVVVRERRQWPRGLDEPRGNIAAGLRCAPGRALCEAGDGGWGSEVAALLERAERTETEPADLDDELVTGIGAALGRWEWDRRPTWVCPIPSVRRPGLTESIAARLGALGRLPVARVVTRASARAPQARMGNSAHQCANVWGAFSLGELPPPASAGPVLLVDDFTRSGWTMTVVGALLAERGCAVLPFVLERR